MLCKQLIRLSPLEPHLYSHPQRWQDALPKTSVGFCSVNPVAAPPLSLLHLGFSVLGLPLSNYLPISIVLWLLPPVLVFMRLYFWKVVFLSSQYVLKGSGGKHSCVSALSHWCLRQLHHWSGRVVLSGPIQLTLAVRTVHSDEQIRIKGKSNTQGIDLLQGLMEYTGVGYRFLDANVNTCPFFPTVAFRSSSNAAT